MPKTTFFLLLHLKSDFSHWKQLQKHTLSCNMEEITWPNDSSSKNTLSKNFFIPHSKMSIFPDWGVVPSPSFFSTSWLAREKRFALSATSVLALLFHQIPSFYDVCRRNERGESGTLVSAHLSVRWIVVQPSISPLVHKRKSLKTARKTC